MLLLLCKISKILEDIALKKSFLFTASAALMFLFGNINASAESDVLSDSARLLPSSGEFVVEPSKTTRASSCTTTYAFDTALKHPLFSAPYTLSTSTSYENCGSGLERKDISLVYVKAKLYQDGAFVSSSEDTTKNGSYAGAKVTFEDAAFSIFSGYGEHKFKESGQMEHNFNTYDEQ